MDARSIISRDTLIPLGAIGTVIGGVVWLTTMYSDVQYLKRGITQHESQLKDITVSARESDTRILKMEEKMTVIIEKLDEIKKQIAAKR